MYVIPMTIHYTCMLFPLAYITYMYVTPIKLNYQKHKHLRRKVKSNYRQKPCGPKYMTFGMKINSTHKYGQ